MVAPSERIARSRSVADTAFSIAVVRAEEALRPPPERLFEDPYAGFFAAAGAHAAESTQRFLELPGFRDGIRLRTRAIDDAVREGRAVGLDQFVILGAGFDARALRMRELAEPGVRVFEVDTREQLARKREILADHGITIPPQVAYTPFDFDDANLETDLGRALAADGLRAGASAMFVWEGVIGYIDDAAIDRSLRFMAATGGPRSRVVFTYGFLSFDPETAEARVRRMGFTSCSEASGDDLWRRYLGGEPHPNAFSMKVGVAIV